VGKANRRKFSKAFKREAVQLFRSSGKNLSQVARELGIGSSVLGAWVAMVEAEVKTGLTSDELEELKQLRKDNARLQMEVEILGKATAFFATRKPMRFSFIAAKKAEYPVSTLCKVMQVRRSGFYAWSLRGVSDRAQVDQQLAVEVRAVFGEHKRRYGSPRVHRELGKRGTKVCRHRVARLMREQDLRARPRRRYARTTDSRHSLPTAPNLLARNFTVDGPDRVWAGDVTYLPTLEGWLYLAVLLDLYSRRVVGWALSERNDEALTLAALERALGQRQPLSGLLHHSDRGTTYASGTYQDVLVQNGIVCSMSRKGNCWDNAVAESFFSTLDIECGNQEPFSSRAEARRLVLDYILGYYNPTRLHSFLGYESPMEFERAA
jgi:transposase InsO family protein/transposase-like protein